MGTYSIGVHKLKADCVADILGVMQAPEVAPPVLVEDVRTALLTLTLDQVKAIHDLIVYCETH